MSIIKDLNKTINSEAFTEKSKPIQTKKIDYEKVLENLKNQMSKEMVEALNVIMDYYSNKLNKVVVPQNKELFKDTKEYPLNIEAVKKVTDEFKTLENVNNIPADVKAAFDVFYKEYKKVEKTNKIKPSTIVIPQPDFVKNKQTEMKLSKTKEEILAEKAKKPLFSTDAVKDLPKVEVSKETLELMKLWDKAFKEEIKKMHEAMKLEEEHKANMQKKPKSQDPQKLPSDAYGKPKTRG